VRLSIEVAVDIDKDRKVWMVGSATDVEVEDVGDVARQLVEHTTGNALAAFGAAVDRLGVSVDPNAASVVAAARAGAQLPPSERPPRPEDPESMRTFGDDDEGE
jgi:hypothetical protein